MKKFILFSVIFIFLAGLGWGQAVEFLWIGEGSPGDWLDDDNWDEGASPGDGYPSYTIIIESSSNNPVFSGLALECDKLTIQSGASLDMGASNLTVDTLDNLGELILAGHAGQSVLITNDTANETVIYDDSGGVNFAGLKTFKNLIIKNGTRAGVGAITVNGNFTLISGSLTAASIDVTGTSSIDADVSTTGDQTYTGAVTFGGAGTRILTSTDGSIAAAGVVTGAGIAVYASQGISLENPANALSGNITLDNTQTGITPAGDISFTNDSPSVNLSAENNSAAGSIDINQTGDLIIDSLITSSGGSITVNAAGDVTQTGAIETGSLTVETEKGITLGEDNIVNTVSLESKAVVSAQGNIIYKNDVGASNALEVTAVTAGNISITETTGALDVSGISSGADVNLIAKTDIDTKGIAVLGIVNIEADGDITVDGAINTNNTVTLNAGGEITVDGAINTNNKVTLDAGGNITVSGDITALQLTAKAAGTGVVTVNTVNIDISNTGSEGINAAIYIKAANFVVTSGTADSIVPGGSGGQLCLELGISWTNTNNVVDGVENVRWHQHFLDLSASHLVYGTLPPGFSVTPVVHVPADDVKTTFDLGSGFSVYIIDADNANASGLSFKTSGAGFIEFRGTNSFEKITIESGNGIHLADTEITVTNGFELTYGEEVELIASSSPGTGSEIKAANITLNNITTTLNKDLTLTATSGNIIIGGNAGTNTNRIGDLTVDSANNNTFTGNVFAKNVSMTGAGTTIDADVTTNGTQTYNGAVILGGNAELTGSTVTLGTITGGGKSLTITGDGVLHGGSNINILSVSGAASIDQDITTTGNQTYTGVVTLGANIELEGLTVTLGAITGNTHSLTITGNGVLNGGNGIGDLLVSGNFNLPNGTLSAAKVNVTGTSTIKENITTTGGTQNYGAVTLSDDITLTGSTVTLGTVTGGGKSLTIDGDGIFSGGSGIDNLTVTGDFSLAGAALSAENVNVDGTSSIAADISTISGTQTYTGDVTLGGTGIRKLEGVTVTLGVIIGEEVSLTITGDGVLNGGSGINVLEISGTAVINGNITTIGDQEYTGAVTLDGSGSGSGIRTITSNNGDILFSSTLDVVDKTQHKIELLARGGNITVSGQIKAYQLIAKAQGTVSVNKIFIDESNDGNDGLSAAIYIEAFDFVVTTTDINSIVPGDNTGTRWGQLCLVLYQDWDDTDGVVDGGEDTDADNLSLTGARWHKHVIDFSNKHLVYGTMPAITIPGPYEVISNNNLRSIFILDTGYNVYINNAEITPNNSLGLSFITDGGFIEFHGENEINNISLESDIGINLVDAKIVIKGDFELIHNEGITLKDNSLSGTGINSIKAANISLNNIYAENNENLTLETTSGDVNLNGTVGTSSEYIGDIIINSADKVNLSKDLYAKSINVTSPGVTIGADITTTGAQTYSGAVTINGGNRTLEGATVTLGDISGNSNSLTITGDGVLNGGNDINNLTVTENFTLAGGLLEAASINITNIAKKSILAGNITTSGTQTYSGQVELGGTGTKTLEGTTLTLGNVTGNGNSLTINGSGVLNGGSGINALSVEGNFSLAGGSLNAAEINITGTSNIAADITSDGNQTYTGAVTLSGSERIISSQNANIEFKNTLNSSGKIELSAAKGNITVSGKITALQLKVKAANGIVSVDEIVIDLSNTGNEGENAAIYVVADKFVVTTTAENSIIPGGTGGQLCLVLDKKWDDVNGVVDGPEDGETLGSVPGARWHQHVTIILVGKILYSFTEDSNGNGKLDRIRIQANTALNGDFTGFDVSVTGYEIDKSKGNITNGLGFDLVSTLTGKTPFDDDSFYIYLKENPENDGDKTPLWSVTKNTSLANKTGYAVGDPDVDKDIKPIDTIPPRIVYTLTLPGHPQTYMQVSEPVVSPSGSDISALFGGNLSVQSVNKVNPSGLGYLFNLSGPLKIEDLAKIIDSATLDNGYFQTDAVDLGQKPEDLSETDTEAKSPKYPLDWSYSKYVRVSSNGNVEDETGPITKPLTDILIPPNKLLTKDLTSNPRRVTDILVSLAPADTNSDNYFAWPVWARFKKSLNASYAPGNDIFWGQQPTDTGIIWQFDGSSFLETNYFDTNEGLELQARLNNNLLGTPVLYWTTANIPAEYRNPQEATEAKKTGGLWLPDVLSLPYNYVPLSKGINEKPDDGSSSKLFNYDITADKLTVNSGDKFEFIFRLSNTSDLFIARLDIPRGAVIPANWYTLIRPFTFDIQNIRRQRGGVSVLNNVINSNNRETAFIRYHLTRPGRVTVQIYTLDGTLIKSLRRNEQRDAGEWTDSWDGTNNGGRAVARGMYFVRVVGPDIDEIRKIMVVK